MDIKYSGFCRGQGNKLKPLHVLNYEANREESEKGEWNTWERAED